MDDKMTVQIDLMLAQISESISEIRRALVVSGSVTAQTSTENQQKSYPSRELREVASREYTSGRWVKRDGDIYGVAVTPQPARPAVVPSLTTGEPRGDSKAGNL